jgi:hypothetical protein
MALGIEQNNLAPQLIQNSGAALVQGIRQIGQQISGHLVELQTKRDLAAMGQELQGINVQSNEFPVQLTQMLSRHPLAARDERGQMALSILGKAHGQWQAGEAEARAFNRAMAMQGARDRSARDLYDYKRTKEMETPQNIGGALVVPQDPVTGQPNVLIPPPARAGAGPRTLSPGAILVDPSGKKLAENPKLPTGGAGSSQRRLAIEAQLRDVNRDMQFDVKEHQRLLKEEEEIKKEMEGVEDEKQKADLEYRRSVKAMDAEKALRKINEARLKKVKLGEDLGGLSEEVEPELGAVPLGAVLPAPGAVAPAASNTEFVLVLDPDGKPGRVRASQLESALANGYRRR